jgi:hypothetical protein
LIIIPATPSHLEYAIESVNHTPLGHSDKIETGDTVSIKASVLDRFGI